MDNSKRNIHNSGPLGMLIKTGQIARVDEPNSTTETEVENPSQKPTSEQTSRYYFETKTGIKFKEHELMTVDPKICEPWKYANRLEDDMGDMDELIKSIQLHGQLQPVLIRQHPQPHDGIKYEIIFGRRRHLACLKLGISLIAIKKDMPNIQDAIASQDAENRSRKNVSNYANALLYKKLLKDGVFKEERELAQKLGLSTSSMSELMAYAKIPQEIVQLIPNIHNLSNSMALRLVSLLKKNASAHKSLCKVAPQIGVTITSPDKLEKAITAEKGVRTNTASETTRTYSSAAGTKLFTLRNTHRGVPSIVFNKNLNDKVNYLELCERLHQYLKEKIA